MSGDIFLYHGNLLGRDVLGEVAASFPALKVVVRAIGSMADNREVSSFHAFDGGDLL